MTCSRSATPSKRSSRVGELVTEALRAVDSGESDLTDDELVLMFTLSLIGAGHGTTMAQLTDVLERLGDKARDVRILFVSVDPHRDTPDMLQAYVNAFNRNAIGLTGTERQIADLARRYRVAYQIEKPRPGDDADVYNVTHSRGVYIFDNRGKARLLASDSESVEALTADLAKLLDQTGAG